MSLLLLSVMGGFAHAAQLVAFIEMSEDGHRLVDAVVVPGQAPRLPPAEAGLSLEILDSEGRSLGVARVPDPRERSVAFPEGGGAGLTLDRAIARVVLDWPDAAARIGLGAQRLSPRARPPADPVSILNSGPAGERLDILFLGDGYTAGELDQFASDVDRMVAHLLSLEPYGAYSSMFNVWRVDAASAESGASHYEDSPQLIRDTEYGCYYGCGGIERLVCCDDGAVIDAISENLPDADGVMVLINDEEYGGAGGFTYATSYVAEPWGEQVMAHELGHSFVGLWDEYSYGSAREGDGPNCKADPSGEGWAQWLDEADVSAFPTCSYTNLYRPTDNACMMNGLQDQYCPVCREQAVLAIYGRLPGLIVDLSPDKGTVVSGGPFEIDLLGPTDGALTHAWTLDGAPISEDLDPALADCGPSGELVYEVHDPTPWVRVDPERRLWDGASWTLEREPCEVATDSDEGAGDSAIAEDTDGDSGGRDDKGCGCASGPAQAPWLGLLAIVAILRRRRIQ